ncbi:MAG: M20/M25/M40 family metallo-hydrolase [Armatimonadetes bacterium]|nr:M20/M25/M40 family metallo-hydrolase [Armatimonadota bacterium]
MNEDTRELLDEILVTHSPCGREEEVEEICLRRFGEYCDEVWRDPHSNVIGKIAGASSADATLLLAHKDEISTMVRKVDEDGKLWLEPLGGTVPWRYGEGPYDVLGDEWLTGILSVGSTHSSHLSSRIHKAKHEKPLDWETCYLDCKLSKAELAEKGVGVGSLGCISRLRKQPLYLRDKFVAGYGLDDKAALVTLFLTMREIRASGSKPPLDVYFAATSSEEIGISGGAYVIRSLIADRTVNTVIASEIAPVAEEYPTVLDERPVILMKDAMFVYHPGLCRELQQTCARLALGHQEIVVRSFGSDTSMAVKYGYIGRAGCVGFATENTHGCEVTTVAGIENVGKLLAGFVRG